MLLFAGLGNPGPQYASNRHNVGFRVVDAIHRRHQFRPWWRRFNAMIADGEIGHARVLLLKPETLMNASGVSIREACDFYKLVSSDLFVFHDEIELPFGKVGIKRGGGDRGHKGLRSITAVYGPYYTRIRVGVGRPDIKDLVHAHVLSNFSAFENEVIDFICDSIAELSHYLIEGKIEELQNHVDLLVAGKFTPKHFEPRFDSD
jgi:peptidyl-tRNA hydrolase, PTH1 family